MHGNLATRLEDTVTVTFFRNQAARSRTEQAMSLEELRDKVIRTTASAKTDLPWCKFAVFSDERTDRGSLRHDRNVRFITGIEGDYDAGLVPFEDAVEAMRRNSITALRFTRRRATRMMHQGGGYYVPRHVIYLQRIARNWLRVNGALSGALGNESFTLSQSYYFGSVNSNPDHCAEIVYGDHIDLRDDLDERAIWNALEPVRKNDNAFLRTAGKQSSKPPMDVEAALRARRRMVTSTTLSYAWRRR